MNESGSSCGKNVRPARRRRRRRRPQPQQHDHNEARNNETKSAFASSLTILWPLALSSLAVRGADSTLICGSVCVCSRSRRSLLSPTLHTTGPPDSSVPFRAIDPLRSDQLTFSGSSCVFGPVTQICHFSHRQDTNRKHALSLRSCWTPLPSRKSTPSATTKRASQRKWGTKFFHDCKE